MNVVVLAIFVGVALTLIMLALAFGGGASGSRGQLSKRAQGLRRRQTATGASQGKGGQAPASLKRTQGGSVPLMDDLAKRFLPRQSALKDRLSRTGRDISLGTYIMISVGVALAVFIVIWLVFGLPVLLASPLAVAAGVGLPTLR